MRCSSWPPHWMSQADTPRATASSAPTRITPGGNRYELNTYDYDQVRVAREKAATV